MIWCNTTAKDIALLLVDLACDCVVCVYVNGAR